MNFFLTMNPNSKHFFSWRGGGGVARVSDFFHKESKLKKKFFFVWGGGWGRDRWMDRRTGPNQLAPSFSSNNALMYKLCP